MKARLLAAACAMAMLSLSTSSAFAAPISGVSVNSFSSEFGAGWDLFAVNTINGSGLSGSPPVHAQMNYGAANSWQTNQTDGTGWIIYDLGASYSLGSIHVWNLNFYYPYNGRGARNVSLLTSSDLSVWNSNGSFEFAMATGLDNDTGFDLNFSQPWDAARYIKFDITSNWGGIDNAGHTGLSEVQFFAYEEPTGGQVREPEALLLVGLGLAALAISKRSLPPV